MWVGGSHTDYKTNLSSQLDLHETGQPELSLAKIPLTSGRKDTTFLVESDQNFELKAQPNRKFGKVHFGSCRPFGGRMPPSPLGCTMGYNVNLSAIVSP